MAKKRRRTYLIKTGLQLKYMGLIVTIMLMVSFGVGYFIYHTSWSQIINTPDLSLDQLADIFDTINMILIRWIVLFVLLIALLSIFISHKIAGPVYRLEETTKLIASGDLTHQVNLRHGDELVDLRDAFNMMTESLRKMVLKDREIIKRLTTSTETLRKSIDNKSQNPEVLEKITSDLNEIISELQTITSAFKITTESE